MCLLCSNTIPERFTYLDIENCSELKSISSLPSKIKSLHVDNCVNIATIDCTGLESILLKNCENLSEITSEENLVNLTIQNCPKLRFPSNLPSLTYLLTDNGEIPRLENLTTLYARECKNLPSAENFPNLKKLEVSGKVPDSYFEKTYDAVDWYNARSCDKKFFKTKFLSLEYPIYVEELSLPESCGIKTLFINGGQLDTIKCPTVEKLCLDDCSSLEKIDCKNLVELVLEDWHYIKYIISDKNVTIDTQNGKLVEDVLYLSHNPCNVQLIDSMGSDLTVVNAARVSFGAESKEFTEKDAKLVNYLAREKHFSPFRHPMLSFRLEMPEFIARQLYKHVVGIESTTFPTKDHAWSEISGRYKTLEKFYIPSVWHLQHEKAKQCSGGPIDETSQKNITERVLENTYKTFVLYKDMLNSGVSREEARQCLPLSFMTEVIWTASLQAVAHFIRLRNDEHAQAEIRELASRMEKVVQEKFPHAYPALAKNQ